MDAMYLGIVLSMALYNFFLFFFLRNKAYLYYSFYVVMCAAFIGSIHGWASFYLLPDFNFIHQYGYPIYLSIGLIALCYFAMSRAGCHAS